MPNINLPEDYVLVLHQVEENGIEDFANLSESLQFDSARLSHIVKSLRNKGLVSLNRRAQEVWIRLSSKGRRLAHLR